MMTIERLTDIHGRVQPGFFVRNKTNKVLAIGAFCSDPFVMPSRKRYARDLDLCIALGKLTGCPVKWNLSYWGNQLSSGTRQDLMRKVRRQQRFAR